MAKYSDNPNEVTSLDFTDDEFFGFEQDDNMVKVKASVVKSKINEELSNSKADKSNVLELDNTDAFTPSADYHPATKKYVDDSVESKDTLDELHDVDLTTPAEKQLLSYDATAGDWINRTKAAAEVEDINNKVSSFQVTPDDTHYPTEKLTKDTVDELAGTGRTTETVKDNADDISTLNSDSSTSGSVAYRIKNDAETGDFTPGASGLDSITINTAIKEIYAEKASANGIATLDASSKIPSAQLPISAMEYKGSWDASTGTYPTSPDTGDYWLVSVAGTTGGEDYDAGDAIIYNGSSWDKINKIEIAEEVSLSSTRYTAADVKNALEEIAGSGRTDETVKGNADDIDNLETAETAMKGSGWTDENLVNHESRIEQLEYAHEQFGIEYDHSTDTLTPLGNSIGKSYTYDIDGDVTRVISDYDGVAPFDWKRCNRADDGTINAYYGDPTYVEDGSNGQVMVEIRKFYYRSTYDSANDKYRYYVSPSPLSGFSLHPAFIRDGEVVDYVYTGAFEATAYDVSESVYVGDGIFDNVNDILASVANLQPLSGDITHFDIEEARAMAQNRGYNWNLHDYLAVCAMQLLFIIEFVSLNWQSESKGLSEGITNLDSGSGNHSQNTGHTSALGNSSGWVVINTLENGATGADSTKAVSYRGIENPFGNIWTFIDGLNVNDNLAYYADHGFTSDTTTGYTEIGTLGNTNGYFSEHFWSIAHNFGFLPISVVDGSSSEYFHDYYYQNTGWRIALLGGLWHYSASAGGFLWSLYNSSAYSSRYVGARVFSW